MSNTNRNPVTEIELATFVAELSKFVNLRDHEQYPNCAANWRIIVSEPGKRYARLVSKNEIVREGGFDHRSAFCFIDLTNGDILKAASWKAPAKHARGNIRVGTVADSWNGSVSYYGAVYL
jgi:hypothetical protein